MCERGFDNFVNLELIIGKSFPQAPFLFLNVQAKEYRLCRECLKKKMNGAQIETHTKAQQRVEKEYSGWEN